MDPISRPVQLACPAGPSSWSVQPTRSCGLRSRLAQSTRPVGSCSCFMRLTHSEPACFTPRMTDHSSRFWRRVHLDLVRYAGCMCRPSC
ncbi:putative leader peptide [Streptomyces sp. NPDC048197]